MEESKSPRPEIRCLRIVPSQLFQRYDGNQRLLVALSALSEHPGRETFKNATAALRDLVQEKRRVGAKYRTDLEILYWLAAIWSFVALRADIPGFRDATGYNVCYNIPTNELFKLRYDYKSLGYERLELLTATDKRLISETFGEPSQHSTLNALLRNEWDYWCEQYAEARLERKRKTDENFGTINDESSSKIEVENAPNEAEALEVRTFCKICRKPFVYNAKRLEVASSKGFFRWLFTFNSAFLTAFFLFFVASLVAQEKRGEYALNAFLYFAFLAFVQVVGGLYKALASVGGEKFDVVCPHCSLNVSVDVVKRVAEPISKWRRFPGAARFFICGLLAVVAPFVIAFDDIDSASSKPSGPHIETEEESRIRVQQNIEDLASKAWGQKVPNASWRDHAEIKDCFRAADFSKIGRETGIVYNFSGVIKYKRGEVNGEIEIRGTAVDSPGRGTVIGELTIGKNKIVL